MSKINGSVQLMICNIKHIISWAGSLWLTGYMLKSLWCVHYLKSVRLKCPCFIFGLYWRGSTRLTIIPFHLRFHSHSGYTTGYIKMDVVDVKSPPGFVSPHLEDWASAFWPRWVFLEPEVKNVFGCEEEAPSYQQMVDSLIPAVSINCTGAPNNTDSC